MHAWAAWTLVAFVAIAGCSGGDGDGTTSSTTSTATSGGTGGPGTTSQGTTSSAGTSAAANRAPSADIKPSLLAGPAPLAINITVDGLDPDGDGLSWALGFGDGTADATGDALPKTVSHTFSAIGNYTLTLRVSDGELEANATQVVRVTAAGGGKLPEDLTFTGTAEGVPAIPQVGSPNGDTYEFPFKFEGAASKMVVSLTYTDVDPEGTGLVTDLDFTLTGPGGFEEERLNQGQEEPVEVAKPTAGDWNVSVVPYSVPGSVDFTVTVDFS